MSILDLQRIGVYIVAACAITSVYAVSNADSLTGEGSAFLKGSRYRLPPDISISQIIVKFHESAGIRARGGALQQISISASEATLFSGDVVGGINAVHGLAKLHGFKVRRLIEELDEEKLDEIRERGEKNSSQKLADMNSYVRLSLLGVMKFSQIEKIIDQLNSLDVVEFAYAEPDAELPNHIPTPNFNADQGYLDVAPGGIDARYAWTVAGGRGDGVRIVDVEGAWRTTHEDLPGLLANSGNFIDGLSWRDHGTAVLGVVAARDNAFGVTGIANNASIGVQTHNQIGAAAAITLAAETAQAGGVILLEMHRSGPADASPCTCNLGQCNYLPVEFWQADFDAIRAATANGVIVVEAAGNGSVDLDDNAYGGVFNRATRDSGAILVGASSSASRFPACWTNFGSRVDVHGWGENVVTLGYGYLFNGGHTEENQFYTGTFSGTSSASPIVVGAVASIMGVRRARNLPALSSVEMRTLLTSTGTEQVVDTRNIGPLPNVRSAIDAQPQPVGQLPWLATVLSLITE